MTCRVPAEYEPKVGETIVLEVRRISKQSNDLLTIIQASEIKSVTPIPNCKEGDELVEVEF
jgi:hypothetical protein